MRIDYRILVVVPLFLLGITLLLAPQAGAVPLTYPAATLSPQQCDPSGPPKYACAYISYRIFNNGSLTYEVDDRYYKGAIDGGAKQWRIDYFIDYRKNASGAWERSSSGFGPTTYATNQTFGSWGDFSQINAQVTTGAYSIVLFKYYEWNAQNPGGYYWYQGPYYFYL